MTEIINNPSSEGGNSMAMMLGLIMIVVVIGLFFIYGLPALRQGSVQPSANTQPNIQIPDKVDVNIQPPAGSGDQNKGQ